MSAGKDEDKENEDEEEGALEEEPRSSMTSSNHESDNDDNSDEDNRPSSHTPTKKNEGSSSSNSNEEVHYTHSPEPSLLIPITSSTNNNNNNSTNSSSPRDASIIEIFPEEVPLIPTSTLQSVFADEKASMTVWADAALLYVKGNKVTEGAELLRTAVNDYKRGNTFMSGDREETLRLLASAGMSNLMVAHKMGASAAAAAAAANPNTSTNNTNNNNNNNNNSSNNNNNNDNNEREELIAAAEDRFVQADKIDQIFPMIWIGKGMLNLATGRYGHARFFFDTTLKDAQKGKSPHLPALPALLGMASVEYREGHYTKAQDLYGQAIQLYPRFCGASVRVGYGMCCYQLGQVDRAKAAFRRAHAVDPEHVPAMAALAVLDLSTLDPTAKDYLSKQEGAIKLLSLANLLDRSHASVSNHLADHYFWKWLQVPGITVSVQRGKNVVKCSRSLNVEPGERMRIGTSFETHVAEEEELEGGGGGILVGGDKTEFVMKDAWTGASAENLKLWRKDYDRVVDMAKSALTSTTVPHLQAESLFLLARVYHIRGEMDEAYKYYNRACRLSPELTPARFGLAQTLVWQERLEEAAANLKLVLGNSPLGTDAYAVLGLLEARLAGRVHRAGGSATSTSTATATGGSNPNNAATKMKEAMTHLKKAAELDPTDPSLVLLQALALQQYESSYPQALERYSKAMQMLQRLKQDPPPEAYVNMGVMSQEMKKYEKAMEYYGLALGVLAKKDDFAAGEGDDEEEEDGKTKEEGGKKKKKKRGASGYTEEEARKAVEDTSWTLEEEGNALFCTYVESGFLAKPPSSDNTNKLILLDSPHKKDGEEEENKSQEESNKDKWDPKVILSVGALVRLGPSFVTQVTEVVKREVPAVTVLHVKDSFSLADVQPPPPKKDDDDEDANKDDKKDKDSKDVSDKDPNTANTATMEKKDVVIYLKRPHHKRLANPLAISIAFNVARLHEDAKRILAAIELHKAILKKHPTYVNSYLRLACIARDFGSLEECSMWLKGAVTVAPGNPEVLTLVGNLHLSLADWAPAQSLFDGLLSSKDSNVEAYAQLSLGNIYFSNLNAPGKYTKHLQHASDYYRRMLQKDGSNFYAANGLGTVLAEKADLFQAKEIFNRVREVSGDAVPDALLNLGHIYLAQKKHPFALQMYASYQNRTNKFVSDGSGGGSDDKNNGGVRSNTKDDAEVLLYIAFAYFDWARQAESFNNASAAPADERYAKCMEHLELAMKGDKDNLVLKYNWCMVKLQAANCVLQKLTRNIQRTAKEVQDALTGLEESLPIVQQLLKWKGEGKKIPVSRVMLVTFISQCQGNIESAKSHLSEELKKEAEAKEMRELQRMEALTQQKNREMEAKMKKEAERRKQEQNEMKARRKMEQAYNLVAGWEHEAQSQAQAAERKKAKRMDGPKLEAVDDQALIPSAADTAVNVRALFDSDEDDDDDDDANNQKQEETKKDDDEDEQAKKTETEKDLFGESTDEESSDEELVPTESSKRARDDEETEEEDDDDSPSGKKRRVLDD